MNGSLGSCIVSHSEKSGLRDVVHRSFINPMDRRELVGRSRAALAFWHRLSVEPPVVLYTCILPRTHLPPLHDDARSLKGPPNIGNQTFPSANLKKRNDVKYNDCNGGSRSTEKQVDSVAVMICCREIRFQLKCLKSLYPNAISPVVSRNAEY